MNTYKDNRGGVEHTSKVTDSNWALYRSI